MEEVEEDIFDFEVRVREELKVDDLADAMRVDLRVEGSSRVFPSPTSARLILHLMMSLSSFVSEEACALSKSKSGLP